MDTELYSIYMSLMKARQYNRRILNGETEPNLYVIDDKNHKEIAQLLGIKENTSASQLHKAKSMLAQKIKHYRTINSI